VSHVMDHTRARLKVAGADADRNSMLFLIVLTTGYFAGIVWLRRSRGAAALPSAADGPALALPDLDQPPLAAVGWPPMGAGLPSYLDEGFAALDAFLAEDHAI
jgi:hypothetical protein